MTTTQVGLHASLTSLALIFLWRLIRRPKIRHPPSPTSLPFVGNLFSIPSGHEYAAFAKLGEQLESDIIYIEILGHKHIILNSIEAASDILEKRAASHSDRPPIPMVKNPELMNWAGFVSFLEYSDTWRHYRRMMNNWLNVRAVTQFNELQEQQACLFMQRLLNVTKYPQPFKCVKNEIVFATGSLMLQLAYGYRPHGPEDSFFKEAKLAFHNLLSAGMQTNFLVNVFPVLAYVPDWFPGASWKRVGREYGVQQEKAKTKPFEWLKTQIARGTHQPSLLAPLLQDHQLLSGLSPLEKNRRLKEVGIVLFGGGVDTTSSFLISFIAAIVLNPQVQTKAQQELDGVLGQVVLPRISDREHLPYVQNLISEILRLYPVGPLGLPHACFQDDNYRGYDIEKGTTIIGNIWAMGRDSRHYKHPEMFDPDRYLDPRVVRPPVFGWGRRKCPGNHFAEASVFIIAASLLSTFTFSRKKNSDGEDIIPNIEMERNALIVELKPFDFEFKPRSKEHYQLILGPNIDKCGA